MMVSEEEEKGDGESDGNISENQQKEDVTQDDRGAQEDEEELEQHVQLAAERILDELSDEQREEIVDEVGENVVRRLSEDQPSVLMRQFESKVVGHVPVLHRSRAAREGMEGVARTVFDGQSGDIISDIGEVIVDALVQEQADELVEDIIYETVQKMHEKAEEEE